MPVVLQTAIMLPIPLFRVIDHLRLAAYSWLSCEALLLLGLGHFLAFNAVCIYGFCCASL